MKSLLSFVFFLSVFVYPSQACVHVPITYEGTISARKHEAIIIHDGQREELVLRINYSIQGKGSAPTFAWVVTVPNEPDQYSVAKAKLFEELFIWSEKNLEMPRPQLKARNADAVQMDGLPSGLTFSKPVKVGPYDIQPIKGKGRQAVDSLVTWFSDNGFAAPGAEQMEYFVKHGFTFLCIKMKPAEDETGVAPSGSVAPLHLSFESKRLYYPLLFSSHSGVFDLDLYILSRSELDYSKNESTLERMRWINKKGYYTNVKTAPDNLPETVRAVIEKSKLKKLDGFLSAITDRWYVNLIKCWGINSKGHEIANWSEDIFFQ